MVAPLEPQDVCVLRGFAFSDRTECLRRLIALIQEILCDLEFKEFEIEELQQQLKGVKNE